MGALWHAENPHTQHRLVPKLTLTGRLEGTFRGRPVEIEADDRELLIRVPNLRSAWGLRRGVTSSTFRILRAIRDVGLRLTLRVGTRLSVPILPDPHLAVRLTMPSLRFSE
jgi:hypothetical protein